VSATKPSQSVGTDNARWDGSHWVHLRFAGALAAQVELPLALFGGHPRGVNDAADSAHADHE